MVSPYVTNRIVEAHSMKRAASRTSSFEISCISPPRHFHSILFLLTRSCNTCSHSSPFQRSRSSRRMWRYWLIAVALACKFVDGEPRRQFTRRGDKTPVPLAQHRSRNVVAPLAQAGRLIGQPSQRGILVHHQLSGATKIVSEQGKQRLYVSRRSQVSAQR